MPRDKAKKKRAGTPKTLAVERLPNAPLSEVVFEMRWALEGAGERPTHLQWDPGYPALADAFTDEAKKAGFGVVRDLHLPTEIAGQSVLKRFYKEKGRDYPLWQIGTGIFAVNESTEYEWDYFKELTLDAIRILMKCYPKMKSFSLIPSHLELRYIDVFDKELVGTLNLMKFSELATNISVDLANIFNDKKRFHELQAARLNLQFPIKELKDSIFLMDYGSGSRGDEAIVRLESKVISKGRGIPSIRNRDKFTKDLGEWLDQARGLTSPFFKMFVKQEVLEKFK